MECLCLIPKSLLNVLLLVLMGLQDQQKASLVHTVFILECVDVKLQYAGQS